jgi:multicomponent Na+:H+ antiporter subunit C
MGNYPYLVALILIVLGLYVALFKRNLIKMIIGIMLIENGVNLFLITLGYREGAVAPIFTHAPSPQMVLPTPQALTLTNIVIGLATTALLLAIVVMVYHHYGTLDANRVNKLRG